MALFTLAAFTFAIIFPGDSIANPGHSIQNPFTLMALILGTLSLRIIGAFINETVNLSADGIYYKTWYGKSIFYPTANMQSPFIIPFSGYEKIYCIPFKNAWTMLFLFPGIRNSASKKYANTREMVSLLRGMKSEHKMRQMDKLET